MLEENLSALMITEKGTFLMKEKMKKGKEKKRSKSIFENKKN